MNKNFIALAIAGALLAAGVVAQSVPPPIPFYGCKDSTGALSNLRVGTAPTCKRGASPVSWNNVGPMGPAGTNGTNGLGVHVWKDANGQTIGPVIERDGNGNQDTSSVELKIGTRVFAVPVQRLFEPTGFGGDPYARTEFGAFLNGPGAGDNFAQRYSPNSDCSPPLYYLAVGADLLGYDVNVAYNKYATDGLTEGRIEMVILNETPAASSVNAHCFLDREGQPHPIDFSFANPRTVAQTINLSESYPAPLSLQ